jgi:hypothetical protein
VCVCVAFFIYFFNVLDSIIMLQLCVFGKLYSMCVLFIYLFFSVLVLLYMDCENCFIFVYLIVCS